MSGSIVSTLTETQMSELPVLYSFRRCPYAIRARLALSYSETPVQLREVVLRDKPPCLVTYSPKGTVPVLVLNNEQVIDESLDIMYWALSNNDPQNLLRKLSPEQEHEAAQLIQKNDGSFKAQLDRYKYADRYPEHKAEDYRSHCEAFLALLDARLALQPYLLGKQISIADIAVMPFIRQFSLVDKPWFDQSRFEHVRQWLNKQLASPRFNALMFKYRQWSPGDTISVFPEGYC